QRSLNSASAGRKAAVSFIVNGLSNEVLVRARSLSLDGLLSSAVPKRVWRRVATSLIADRFTKALLARGRVLNLDTDWSFLKAARVFPKAAMFVVVDGFVNEALIRGCIRAGVNPVSRTRALETAGCRKRAFEKVRCDAVCRRPLSIRYAAYVDFL